MMANDGGRRLLGVELPRGFLGALDAYAVRSE